MSRSRFPFRLTPIPEALARLLSRGLPPNARVTLRVRWPLLVLGVAVVAQLVMPDPVWVSTAAALAVAYGGALLWVRAVGRGLALRRTRTGSLIVAGDTLEERFELENHAAAPLVWAEFIDESDLPGYHIGRVVGVPARGRFLWRTEGVCAQRGVFRLGPHRLLGADPLRLFELDVRFDDSDAVLIYPRVARLPAFPLPRGYASSDAPTRRPLLGSLPAASVRSYLPQDPLRFVHWPSTARHGALMVREMEQEPSGDVWILLDTEAGAHVAEGDHSTLETAVVAAAGLAGQFLEGSGRRAVGLIAASGAGGDLVTLAPGAGSAHLWRFLGALAPVRASTVPLDDLLRAARGLTGPRASLVVVTAHLAGTAAERWTAELVRLAEGGLATGLLLVTTPATAPAAASLRLLLAAHAVPVEALPFDAPLAPALTHRRRRTVLRTTPWGRTFAVEVEEEVA